ncbi:MAG TPA: hypothetical protein VN971_01275, partial [Thermoanaerobaculia bacterium]|nr:hypothetical protein [Thermoanaerobaculia bacterium]
MRPFSPSIAFVLFALSGPATALAPVSPVDAPKATPQLLRELSTGAPEVPVIVALRDGTPSALALRLHPDPAGEAARRVRRIEAQQLLADQMPPGQFQPKHYYESFSL